MLQNSRSGCVCIEVARSLSQVRNFSRVYVTPGIRWHLFGRQHHHYYYYYYYYYYCYYRAALNTQDMCLHFREKITI